MARLWVPDRSPSDAELSIETIIANARRIEERTASLALDVDLRRLAADVVQAASAAAERTRRMRSPLSFSKLRRYIFLLGTAVLVWWVYAQYFQPRPVRIAVTSAESDVIRRSAARNNAEHIEWVDSPGSPANRDLVLNGDADLAVVQGGVDLPDDFKTLGVVRSEYVLFFVRDELPPPDSAVPHVITFRKGQGSHALGKRFLAIWGYPEVGWIHSWEEIATDEHHVIDSGAHAVFVVIDPADPTMQKAIKRIAEAGFRLRDPDIGVHATHSSYLKRRPIRIGYLHLDNPTVPAETGLRSYVVDNHLVAGRTLTYQQEVEAMRAFGLGAADQAFSGTILRSRGDSLMSDLDHVLAVGVNFALIMVALLGVEIMRYRQYIHELNSLISRVSLLQAEHDLFAIEDHSVIRYNQTYLDSCADLLGLLSTIAGFYGKENAALMFNRYTTLIHTRANDLKINIQLKILNSRFRAQDSDDSC